MITIPVPLWAFVLLIISGIPTALFILMIPIVFLIILISDKIEDHLLRKQNKNEGFTETF